MRTDRALDRWQASRRAPAVPAGFADRVMAGVREEPAPQARDAAEAASPTAPARRRLRWAAAAALVLVPVGVLGILLWPGGGTRFTFARAREQIREARSVRFRLHVRIDGRPRTIGVDLREPGLVRQEFSTGLVSIMDARRGRALVLDPARRVATAYVFTDLPSVQDAMMRQAFMARVKELLDGTESALGERTVEGRRARGFRVGTGGRQVDLWFDAETGRPLRFELEAPGWDGPVAMTDFELQADLADERFSLATPPGYDVVTVEVDLEGLKARGMVQGVEVLVALSRFVSGLPEQAASGWSTVVRRIELAPRGGDLAALKRRGDDIYRLLYGYRLFDEGEEAASPRPEDAPSAGPAE